MGLREIWPHNLQSRINGLLYWLEVTLQLAERSDTLHAPVAQSVRGTRLKIVPVWVQVPPGVPIKQFCSL